MDFSEKLREIHRIHALEEECDVESSILELKMMIVAHMDVDPIDEFRCPYGFPRNPRLQW